MDRSTVAAHFEPIRNGAKCRVEGCFQPFVRNVNNTPRAYWNHLKYHHSRLFDSLKPLEESRRSRSDQPYFCAKCRKHGIEVSVKNHSRVCPYSDCECRKCRQLRQLRKEEYRRRTLAQRWPAEASDLESPPANSAEESSSVAESPSSRGSAESRADSLPNGSVGSAASSPSIGSPNPLTDFSVFEPTNSAISPSVPMMTAATVVSPPLDSVATAEAVSPLLRLRLVPAEIGLDFDPLALARLWNQMLDLGVSSEENSR